MADFDVFLSYRHEDGLHVATLVRHLEERGLRVFHDRADIREFEAIADRILQGMACSRTFLAWYSQSYLQSTACTLELARALGMHASRAEARMIVVNPTVTTDHIQP